MRKFNISKPIEKDWKVKMPIFGKIFFLLLQEKVIILKNDIMDKLLTYIPIVIRHKMNHKVLVVSLPKTGAGICFLQLKFVKKIVALIDKQ